MCKALEAAAAAAPQALGLHVAVLTEAGGGAPALHTPRRAAAGRSRDAGSGVVQCWVWVAVLSAPGLWTVSGIGSQALAAGPQSWWTETCQQRAVPPHTASAQYTRARARAHAHSANMCPWPALPCRYERHFEEQQYECVGLEGSAGQSEGCGLLLLLPLVLGLEQKARAGQGAAPGGRFGRCTSGRTGRPGNAVAVNPLL